jgi:hypothetical protein
MSHAIVKKQSDHHLSPSETASYNTTPWLSSGRRDFRFETRLRTERKHTVHVATSGGSVLSCALYTKLAFIGRLSQDFCLTVVVT